MPWVPVVLSVAFVLITHPRVLFPKTFILFHECLDLSASTFVGCAEITGVLRRHLLELTSLTGFEALMLNRILALVANTTVFAHPGFALSILATRIVLVLVLRIHD
jgi:hypothetical protein